MLGRIVIGAAWAVGMFALTYEAFWRPALQGMTRISEVLGP